MADRIAYTTGISVVCVVMIIKLVLPLKSACIFPSIQNQYRLSPDGLSLYGSLTSPSN